MLGGLNFRDCVQAAIFCSCTPLEVGTLCLVWATLEVGVPSIISAGLGVGSGCFRRVFVSRFWNFLVKGIGW